ncbi:hypothetical protein BDB00DRAFT_851687 [Zychaea mexicana]|uniref:uncharacterized protein n=1 Tax=Zychaea mexicana TaxID=64656 RepID=UPI0022FE3A99|nr:uncharacterized protein BDB00DRAFT_851687 [Zychaea mexicana]KAI9485058.1 hypothetical protein BDB00DRAFT_851687 [Zychaea mexicana]
MESMKQRQYSTKTWNEHELQPKKLDASTVDWIFLVDILNFSFWSDLDKSDKCQPHPERYTVVLHGKAYTGYWSLCAAINRALEQGIPVTDASYYANASDDDLKAVFASDTREHIPLMDQRIAVMREAGRVLLEEFDGSFVNCIRQARQSASALLELLTQYFPSFRDIHSFEGRQVAILKRAQILIADIWACFDGQGYGEFYDIDTITMFADYRVPQALYSLGVLKYSADLMTKLEKRELLSSGSREEIEIRGNSIWAVELMVRRIKEIDPTQAVNAILMDFYIWDTAKELQDQMTVPIHRTRSIFY